MKEIIIYSIAIVAVITIFGYSIHMFIGGLVEPETETTLITAGCLLAAGVIGYMAWDIIRRKRENPTK